MSGGKDDRSVRKEFAAVLQQKVERRARSSNCNIDGTACIFLQNIVAKQLGLSLIREPIGL